jgi:GT2 family glycosyltransferase
LSLYQSPFVEVQLFPENKVGLSTVYNQAIDYCSKEPCVLVFAHDDLYLLDFYWINSIMSGLQHFGIVGCAGNKRRQPFQPSWAFKNDQFEWDDPENLSGIVAHGKSIPIEGLSIFGPPLQEVKLMDGLLLAAYSETLIKNKLHFDEQFKFHFYDMDFCRQAEVKGVTMGTIPLSLMHESGGNFSSEAWKQGYQKYIQKWKE